MPAEKGWHRDRWGAVYVGGTRDGNVGATRERMGSVWRKWGKDGSILWRFAYRIHHPDRILWYVGSAYTEADAMQIVEGSHNAYP